MQPEALDAIANKTMRPNALEAATTGEETKHREGNELQENETAHSSNEQPEKPATPFGQRTDGTQSAAKVVEEVVHGVKAAVDVAISWAEKKADELSSTAESTGPYTSPATCMPSDLDAIASGVLPAMPSQVQDEYIQKQHDKDEESKREEHAKDTNNQYGSKVKPP